ncbi:MAG: hypothetical protein KDD41_11760 [Flavobacteriales bacterium]|nr:hypothetical protein [Flavobacteriales bacterium]
MNKQLIKKEVATHSGDEHYQKVKNRSYTYLAFAIFAFFIGIGTIIGMYPLTLTGLFGIAQILAGSLLAGFLVPFKWYQNWFHFIFYDVVVFNVLGLMPFLTALFLVLNFVFSHNTVTTDYRIEKIYLEGEGNNVSHGVILEGNAFSDERKIVEIDDVEFNGFSENTYFRVSVADGLFGIQVVKNREFITKD